MGRQEGARYLGGTGVKQWDGETVRHLLADALFLEPPPSARKAAEVEAEEARSRFHEPLHQLPGEPGREFWFQGMDAKVPKPVQVDEQPLEPRHCLVARCLGGAIGCGRARWEPSRLGVGV